MDEIDKRLDQEQQQIKFSKSESKKESDYEKLDVESAKRNSRWSTLAREVRKSSGSDSSTCSPTNELTNRKSKSNLLEDMKQVNIMYVVILKD